MHRENSSEQWKGIIELPESGVWLIVGPTVVVDLCGLTTVNGTIALTLRDPLNGQVELQPIVLGDQFHPYEPDAPPLTLPQVSPGTLELPAVQEEVLANAGRLALRMRVQIAPQRARGELTFTVTGGQRLARSAP